MSNVIKALDELGYFIKFEYNWKGAQIHTHNPRIGQHIFFEPANHLSKKDDIEWRSRIQYEAKHNNLFVNFSQSLEKALIADENSFEYFLPLDIRRKKNTNICYYDQSMKWAGLTDKKYMGWTGEVYFAEEDHKFVLFGNYHVDRKKPLAGGLDRYKDKFLVLYALRGSMYQKATYPMARTVINTFLDRHKDAIVFTTGDEWCQRLEWERDRIINLSGRIPFSQALLMSRYMNLVVTPETGLGIGAGSYSTPKIMLLTAASLKNVVGNDKNDFSLQSPAWCSPCTRAIYNTRNCPMNRSGHPICVDFNPEEVLAQMETVYNAGIERKPFILKSLGKAYI